MAATGDSPAQRPRTRASREARREQLIEATLSVLERKGLGALTLADVAETAGLSRGIVNFHFESKERLLLETLRHIAAEYDANWRQALVEAGPDPAERLRAVIAADFDPRVGAPNRAAAWFAFFGEAAARADYRELCFARDDAYLATIRTLCKALGDDGRHGRGTDSTAMALYAMQEGLWLRLMLDTAELSREEAQAIALGMLGTLFPAHFTPDGAPRVFD